MGSPCFLGRDTALLVCCLPSFLGFPSKRGHTWNQRPSTIFLQTWIMDARALKDSISHKHSYVPVEIYWWLVTEENYAPQCNLNSESSRVETFSLLYPKKGNLISETFLSVYFSYTQLQLEDNGRKDRTE